MYDMSRMRLIAFNTTKYYLQVSNKVNQQNCYASVCMFPSEKFHVPREIALLYDFVNSLDRRRYVEHGTPHTPGDALATSARLQDWMRKKKLAGAGHRPDSCEHGGVVALRQALREFLELAPDQRESHPAVAARLNAAMANFPMTVGVNAGGVVTLHPVSIAGVGDALVEFHRLAETGRLDRLKTCASDECGWVFYDRSKPGNRRWCSSVICGNREKTRNYRNRWKENLADNR